jgi:hypothetical protein
MTYWSKGNYMRKGFTKAAIAILAIGSVPAVASADLPRVPLDIVSRSLYAHINDYSFSSMECVLAFRELICANKSDGPYALTYIISRRIVEGSIKIQKPQTLAK